jgi:hypothetical protein
MQSIFFVPMKVVFRDSIVNSITFLIIILLSNFKVEIYITDPFLQNSRTIEKLGGLVQAPKNITIFGCLKASMAWHSERKSLRLDSYIPSILNILTATTLSLHFAL